MIIVAYLNTACTKLDGMRKEAGKISNREIQGSVTQVFQYLCVVTLQIIVPVILVTALLLMSASLSSKSPCDCVTGQGVTVTGYTSVCSHSLGYILFWVLCHVSTLALGGVCSKKNSFSGQRRRIPYTAY